MCKYRECSKEKREFIENEKEDMNPYHELSQLMAVSKKRVTWGVT